MFIIFARRWMIVSALPVPTMLAMLACLAGGCQQHVTSARDAAAGGDAEIGATRTAADSPAEALRLLAEGNARYVEGRTRAPRMDEAHRRAQSAAQAPFAVVLSCSDSRAPADQIFDQNPGSLFIVRVAGNIADPATTGSIEYAIAHLRPSLIVVMGHQDCGAVKAARLTAEQTSAEPQNIRYLLDQIRPALRPDDHEGRHDLDESVAANIRHQMQQLQQNNVIARALETGRVKLIGATYEITTGRVHFMD